MINKYIKEEEKFPEELIKKPHEYISSWAESILPHTGKNIFDVLSLMPCSLILPDLKYEGMNIRSNINCLFLATSGAGKTTVTEMFKNFTYSPISVNSITSARLESELKKYADASLIIGDLARVSRDINVMKVIEGVLGEEKSTSRMTMRSESMEEKNIIGLMCGIPNDISAHFSSGNLFRTFPRIIFHNQQQHSDIGKHINGQMGKENTEIKEKEKEIKRYYQELFKIQKGMHNKINPIEGYIIPPEFKEKIYKKWDSLTKKIHEDSNMNFFRELHEYYRILISHCFLNIFNRQIEGNLLVVNEEDLNVALTLGASNIQIKKKIIKCDMFAKTMKDLASLRRAIESDKVDEEIKNILQEGYLKK